MDPYVLAWALRVKARRRHRGATECLPPLWLFTDAVRQPDPLAIVARLPRGLCGVVLRHDDVPERGRVAERLARLCRARRLRLSVAGDWRLAARLRAGVHLRAGRPPGPLPPLTQRLTASAHDVPQARRAMRAGAGIVFLSPIFPTASHRGGRALGLGGWRRLARHATSRAGALGGILGIRVRALPPQCVAMAGITAFDPS